MRKKDEKIILNIFFLILVGKLYLQIKKFKTDVKLMDDSEDDVRELINKGRTHESIDDDFLDEDEGRRYIKYLDKALRLEPTNNSIYLFKARVYKHMHKYRDAVDNYQKYLEKDEDWIDDFLDISECYNQLGSNNQAKIFREYYDDPAVYTQMLIRRRKSSGQEKSNTEIESRGVKDALAGYLRMAIFICIIFAIFILPFLPEKTITFCGDKWKKDIDILSATSWNIKEDLDGNCVLVGSGKISIPTQIFSRIKIIPAEKSPTDFEFKVGEYYTAGSGITGTPCRPIGWVSYAPLFYQPYFAYNNNMKDKTDNKCVEYYPNLQDITLSRSVTGWERNLQLSIADNALAEMMLGSGNHQPATGGVTFYSSQIDIAEIKIYCDMRCIIERISNLVET